LRSSTRKRAFAPGSRTPNSWPGVSLEAIGAATNSTWPRARGPQEGECPFATPPTGLALTASACASPIRVGRLHAQLDRKGMALDARTRHEFGALGVLPQERG